MRRTRRRGRVADRRNLESKLVLVSGSLGTFSILSSETLGISLPLTITALILFVLLMFSNQQRNHIQPRASWQASPLPYL